MMLCLTVPGESERAQVHRRLPPPQFLHLPLPTHMVSFFYFHSMKGILVVGSFFSLKAR
jgi:hypothetical protein